MGLLLFELLGWAALHMELDRRLGLGARFWLLVIMATGTCVMAWLSARALVKRRGWFTLKEFLAFVLLIGAACGLAGNLYQKTLSQRRIAEYLRAQGVNVSFGGDSEPGLERRIGSQYFHARKSDPTSAEEARAECAAAVRKLPGCNRADDFAFPHQSDYNDAGIGDLSQSAIHRRRRRDSTRVAANGASIRRAHAC
jgi:hypothetical protein